MPLGNVVCSIKYYTLSNLVGLHCFFAKSLCLTLPLSGSIYITHTTSRKMGPRVLIEVSRVVSHNLGTLDGVWIDNWIY
jgi:hypothetical protein